MAYTGPYPVKFFFTTTAMVVSNTTFTGGITNSGMITPGGIIVENASTINGGIVDNGGTIAGGIIVADTKSTIIGTGSTRTGIIIENTPSFGGVSAMPAQSRASPTPGDLSRHFRLVCYEFRWRRQQQRHNLRTSRRHFRLVCCEFWWRHQQQRHEYRH